MHHEGVKTDEQQRAINAKNIRQFHWKVESSIKPVEFGILEEVDSVRYAQELAEDTGGIQGDPYAVADPRQRLNVSVEKLSDVKRVSANVGSWPGGVQAYHRKGVEKFIIGVPWKPEPHQRYATAGDLNKGQRPFALHDA